VITYSVHWLRHPGLRAAVADFLDQERLEIDQQLVAQRALLPYRQD
jgi:predicted N-acyltransferase